MSINRIVVARRAALAGGALFCLTAGCSPKQEAATPPQETAAPQTPAALEPGAAGAGDAAPTVKAANYTTTKSGLRYRDLKKGTGASPTAGQIVVVHYTGKLENGTVFDSSRGGDPIPFPIGVGRVIPGWDEGVITMKKGGRRELVIPGPLGYGEQGTPDGSIPPNATLIFDVELIDIR